MNANAPTTYQRPSGLQETPATGNPVPNERTNLVANTKPRTIRELRTSGYKPATVKEEMRKNLIAAHPRRARSSSPASSATKRPSSRTSRTPSSPARTSSSSASAARRSPASSARSSTCSTTRSPTIAGCEINDNPFDPICTRWPRPHRRPKATTPRSTGSTATAATARSSPRPTSPSPTSSARSTRSRSPKAATSPTS